MKKTLYNTYSYIKINIIKYMNNINEIIQEKQENNKPIKHWTIDITKRFQEYAFQAMGNSFINGADANYYNSINGIITVWRGVLLAISTIGMAGIIYFVQDRDNYTKIVLFWLCTVLSLVLNITVGIMSAIQSAQNYTSKIVASSINSAKFGALARQIIGEFIKDPQDREDALNLHNHILGRFNELETEKPFMRAESKELWQQQVNSIENHPNNYSSVIKLPAEFRENELNILNINNDQDGSRNINFSHDTYNESDLLIQKHTNPAKQFIKSFL